MRAQAIQTSLVISFKTIFEIDVDDVFNLDDSRNFVESFDDDQSESSLRVEKIERMKFEHTRRFEIYFWAKLVA